MHKLLLAEVNADMVEASAGFEKDQIALIGRTHGDFTALIQLLTGSAW